MGVKNISRFSFLVSDSPLPEIDMTGFVRMTVGEYKKLNIQTKSNSLIDILDDDAVVLYAEDESKTNDLRICTCTNPPYGLDAYTNKEFVYWIEGDCHRESWNEQLYKYLTGLQNNQDGCEIWSIWFGDGYQEINNLELKLKGLRLSELDVLKGTNYCVKFE
ncbi:hypothetical protein D3C81_1121680 [compost metagenome]